MATQPKITVRKARNDDHQAVMDITDDFNKGADYINFYYHELINDPDSTYYVCEVDGEIGAFEGVFLVDDNNTLMSRSVRVKEKFQGQGLILYMRRKIHEDYKDIPGEKRIRSCCTNNVRLVHSARFRSQNRLIGVRILRVYKVPTVLEIPSPYKNCKPGVQELDLDDLSLVFQNKELVSYLFPNGFITVSSWFFDPIVSNIRHIKKLNPFIIISNAFDVKFKKLKASIDADQSQTSIIENSGSHTGRPQGFLAVMTHYTSPYLILYQIELFGHPQEGQEENDTKNILFCALQHAATVKEKDKHNVPLVLGLSLNDNVILDVCHKILSPLGFKTGELDDTRNHFFFEQDFNKLLGD